MNDFGKKCEYCDEGHRICEKCGHELTLNEFLELMNACLNRCLDTTRYLSKRNDKEIGRFFS